MKSSPLPPAAALWLLLTPLVAAEVVINEVHYAPSPDNEAVEFIEFFNAGETTVDLGGWQVTDAFTYTFPAGTELPPDSFFILAQNEAQYNKKFGSIFAGGNKAQGAFTQGILANGGEEITLRDASGQVRDRVDYNDRFPWPVAASGEGSSMELIHPSLDNDLGSHWRSSQGPPTPGEVNSVHALSAPPSIRQVAHRPAAPLPGEEVLVSAKVTDPQGVATVTLRYQHVRPGDYISLDDDRYPEEWTTLDMRDDGQAPDETPDDSIFTVSLPADLQRHRHLLRYQITVSDQDGATITVPYPDDGQPNFAYFCYGEMPAWEGAVEPGESDPVTFSPETLQTVPVYHLLTTKAAHTEAQHIPGSSRGSGYTGSDYLWQGTLIYDGEVYDHIHYRARGGVWRYAMGKNMWKFRFHRSHEFQARDRFGRKYPEKWRRLNFSAIIQQGNFGHRGEHGLFESVGFDLFTMAGVPAPRSHYVHFRIVENSTEENLFGSQYATDFQGLYLAIEQIDGQFLESRDLPDGNIYKMENGTGERNLGGELKHLAAYPAVADSSDLEAFKSDGYEQRSQAEDPEWWRTHFNLERYFSYRSILEYIHHYDTGAGKNYYYYHDHTSGHWQILPWDLDLTWDDGMYSTGSPHRFSTTALALDPFKRDYQNRLVELQDLLFNQEQTGLLIDDRASDIYTSGSPSLVDADRMMWDHNPIMTSRYVNPSKSGAGRYYRIADSQDFAGMIARMKDYIPHRIAFVQSRFINEGKMPAAPTITYLGSEGYPLDDLRFQAGPFKGGSIFAPQQFATLQWRLAEVTDPQADGYEPGTPIAYEIDALWESPALTTEQEPIIVPSAEIRPGRTYRLRARVHNTDGYASHWCDPIQFTAGQPDLQPFLDDLWITEILFDPAEADAGERAAGYETADFEFIELFNRGEHTLDLSHIRFTKGIDFDFANQADRLSLPPGQRLVLAADADAFAHRYGAEALDSLAGTFGGAGGSKLNNQGERLKLAFAAGLPIRDLHFLADETWPSLQPGRSLVLTDIDSNPDAAAGASWSSGSVAGGTPGQPEPDGPASTGYLTWQQSHFTPDQQADVGLAGSSADPDGDGWANVLEYALGGDPWKPLPLGPRLVHRGAQAYLEVSRSDPTPDVVFQVQHSPNLLQWDTLAAGVPLIESGPGRESVLFPLSPQPSGYWRLHITLE